METDIESFITRWQNSGAAERSNYALQPLLSELGPDPTLLSQAFAKKAPKREKEIQKIITTLRTLGQL